MIDASVCILIYPAICLAYDYNCSRFCLRTTIFNRDFLSTFITSLARKFDVEVSILQYIFALFHLSITEFFYTIALPYFCPMRTLNVSITLLVSLEGSSFNSPILFSATEKHLLRNRARRGSGGDWKRRAVSRPVSLSFSIWLSLPLPRFPSLSRDSTLFSAHVLSISFTHADGIRKNVSRSFPPPAVSPPCGFNPSHVLSLFLSHSIYHSFSLGSSSFIVLISLARVIRSLSSHDITPRLCFYLSYSHGISHARIHPLARICLIPLRPVHARASDAECHAYPFCVRAIDAREKLSSRERNAPALFSTYESSVSYGLDYA